MEKYLTFFSETERQEVEMAIAQAEKSCSGEIRVHLEDYCDHRAPDRAAFVFEQLEMHETQERNGVLFYLAVCDQDFALIGDIGIHQHVGQAFWEETTKILQSDFRAGNFKEGLIKAILHVGQSLAQHFPYRSNDVNELSDEISMGRL